jgi:hypothetical protein
MFATEYSTELSMQPVETAEHGTKSDLIVMLNGKFVLPQMVVYGG